MLWPTAAARGGLSRIARRTAPHRRAHDAQRDDHADEVPECQEDVEQSVAVETDGGEAEIEHRGRHARKAVFASGKVRQRIKFDEEEDLRDRHGDHGEIDAGSPERDQPDKIADDACDDGADEQGRHHIGEIQDGEQIGCDHAAGAEESRLPEREQTGEAEQDVEADAEYAPDQNAVDRRRGEAEIWQDERRGNQRRGRQSLNEKGVLPEHQMTALIRGQPCQAIRRDAARAPASWPRTT
jgi:hypothetical protein